MFVLGLFLTWPYVLLLKGRPPSVVRINATNNQLYCDTACQCIDAYRGEKVSVHRGAPMNRGIPNI